jgi:hypothetical protein
MAQLHYDTNTVRQILDIVDDTKTNIPEGDYIRISNALRELHSIAPVQVPPRSDDQLAFMVKTRENRIRNWRVHISTEDRINALQNNMTNLPNTWSDLTIPTKTKIQDAEYDLFHQGVSKHQIRAWYLDARDARRVKETQFLRDEIRDLELMMTPSQDIDE